MALSPEEPHPTPARVGSPYARDLGLRRSRRLTGWTVAAAVAGTAVLGGIYTQVLPGNSTTSTPPAQFSAATVGDEDGGYGEPRSHEDDEGATPATRPALQPPAQPPAATQQPPHTTTGAS